MKTLHLQGFNIKSFIAIPLLLLNILTLSAAGLSGTYTINPKKPASASNYISFNDADSDLTLGARASGGTANGPGVSAAVTFSVADGIYHEQIIFSSIAGASAGNMVTFQSASNDSTKVIVTNNFPGSATTGLGYVLALNNASFLKFNQLTFKRDSASGFDMVLVLQNASDSNIFSNCRFMSDNNHAAYLGTSGALVYSNASNVNSFNTFYNNRLTNSDYAFYWWCNVATPGDGNTFDHNVIDSIGTYGVYGANQIDLKFLNNKVNMPWGGFGVYFQTVNTSAYSPSGVSIIANNFISTGDNPAIGGRNFGLVVIDVDSTIVAYNNINSYGNEALGVTAYVYPTTTTTNLHIYNNNFINLNSGKLHYAMYGIYWLDENYNNFLSKGTNAVYYNSITFSNQSTWTSSGLGFGANDMSVDPIYFSKTDLHIKNPALNNAGIPVPSITSDIDGDLRSTTTPDIGADEISPAADNPEITAITNPGSGYCSGSVDVYVTMGNYGVNTLTSATIEWSVNGTAQTAYSWTGSLATATTTSVKIGTYNFTSGTYTIVSYPSKGNTTSISSTVLNTTSISSNPGMSGTYTIDPAGSGIGNFKSFHAATSQLNNTGNCGATIFKVADGTYLESIVLNQFYSSSNTNTVSFIGNMGDSTKVVLDTTWSYNNGLQSYTVHLNGADNVSFQHMTISHHSASSLLGANGNYSNQAHVMVIDGGADNNSIMHCRILGPGPLNLNSGGITSSKDNDNNTTISNNYFHNSFYPIFMAGSTVSYSGFAESGTLIENNTIDSIQGDAGIFVEFNNAPVITGNKLSGWGSDLYGIEGIYSNTNFGKIRINANKMDLNLGGVGIESVNSGTLKTDSSIVYNNFISVHANSRVGNFGIYSYNDSFQFLMFNNINFVNTDSNTYGIYMYSAIQSNYILNNVILNGSAGYTLFLVNKPSICNFNDLYTTGKRLADLSGTDYFSLGTWRTGSGFDNKSVSVDPIYKSVSDLHVKNPALNGTGNPTKIKVDIDGDTRGATPDMGADEFTPTGYDVAAIAVSRPVGYCSGTYDVYALIRNTGSKKLTSADVSLYVAGTLNKKVSVSGLALNTGDTISVKINSFSFTKGSVYSFMVVAENPDGNTDEDQTNDTAYRIMRPGISGSFTLGGATADFLNFTAAVDSLMLNGICGNVTITAKNGTYNERITVGKIPGISLSSTVTFQGNLTDSTKVTLSANTNGGTSTLPNYVLGFDKASYVTFSHMTIEQLGKASYNNTVSFAGGNDHITLASNQIINVGGRYVLSSGINSLQDADQNISIIGNYISLGWAGILMIGNNTAAPDYGTTIIGNTIEGQHYYGIACQYEDSMQIWANKINMLAGNQGIVLYNGVSNSTTDSNYIANNFVSMQGDSGWGIYCYYSTQTNVYYNSVYNNSSVSGGYSFYAVNNSLNKPVLQVYNNIFYSANASVAIANNQGISFSNYNDLYAPNSNIGYSGGFLNLLSDWQTTTGFDPNSISTNPYFIKVPNLHVTAAKLNGAAIPISSVTVDIDGQKRDPSTPDIGADEFTPLAHDLSAVAIINPASFACGDSNSVISVRIFNPGTSTECTIPVYLRVVQGAKITKGTYTFSLSGAACLAAGKDSIFTVPASAFSINSFSGAVIDSIIVATTLSTDLNHFNDTIVGTKISPDPGSGKPRANGLTVCGTGSVTLTANAGIAGDTLIWYDASGNYLASGPKYVTPTLSSSATYYIKESSSKTDTAIGAKNNLIGGPTSSANYAARTNVMYFHALKTFILDSVTIYSNASANFNIFIRDSATGNLLYRVSESSSGIGPERIGVGFRIPASTNTYTIGFGDTMAALYRNPSGAKFPYLNPAVKITGTSAGSGYYYYFYDWMITYPPSCPNTVAVTVNVGRGFKPTAKFTASPSCAGTVTSVTNSSTIKGKLKSYIYDFGDSSATVATTNSTTGHTYTKVGTFRIRMTVIDTGGCQDTASVLVVINSKSTSKFTCTTGNVCQGGIVSFKDASILPSGKTGNYMYKLYDSSGNLVDTSSAQNPSFTIANAGRYRVVQNVSIAGACADTSSVGILVYDNPKVNFVILNGCAGATAQLRDSSTVNSGTISTWSWDFGNSNKSNIKDPTTKYTKYGAYIISLQVTSSYGCSSAKKYLNINVTKDPDPSFTYVVGSNQTFSFTATEPNYTHTWDFGDSSSGVDTGATISHQYKYASYHNVSLTVTNSAGCSKTKSFGFVTAINQMLKDGEFAWSVYPNPFKDFTLVSYSLPKAALVKLEVLDLMGRSIAVPINNNLNAGNYQMNLNLNDYNRSSGMYILKITVGERVETRYINYLK